MKIPVSGDNMTLSTPGARHVFLFPAQDPAIAAAGPVLVGNRRPRSRPAVRRRSGKSQDRRGDRQPQRHATRPVHRRTRGYGQQRRLPRRGERRRILCRCNGEHRPQQRRRPLDR